MSHDSKTIVALFAIALCIVGCSAQAANYRGVTPGWPNYGNGYVAYQPVSYGNGQAYYAARPATTAYYAGGAAPAVRYVPVNAAYRNPAYMAAYRGMPATNRAPAQAAGYYPAATTAYYAPGAGYNVPTTANYSPNYSYAVSPTGSSSAGSEASVAYAQPMEVNYVPQRVTYRPAYAPAPVYAYRTVTAFAPIQAQPTTCMQPVATVQPTTCFQQPAPTSSCQPRCGSRFSWLNPLNWFRRCGSSGCGASQATTAYCTSGCTPATGCGQPYYPTVPVVPTVPYVPAPITTSPPIITTPIPGSTFIAPAGPRVPSPPTRMPGSTFAPPAAETRPSLSPTFTTPVPGSTITPLPGSSFPTNPSGGFTPTTPPAGSFPTAPGGFGTSPTFPSGSNYPPASDPYGSSINGNTSGAAFGSGLRSGNTIKGVIRAPETGTALPPGVSMVPDLDSKESPRPLNRAPQLVDPRDKSAKNSDPRWAVVPAVWPTNRAARQTPQASHQAQHTTVGFTPSAADYDDRGWRSAR